MRGLGLSCALAIVLAAGDARAVPNTVAFTGRLSTSSGPVDGEVSATFTLFDAATGGSQLWTETHPNLVARAGLVTADLGSSTTLDETIFDGQGARFLQITIGGETLSPRLPIRSLPYAIRAGTANVAERADTADRIGTLDESQLVATVTATSGLTATRSGNAVSVGLTTCPDGQILKSSNAGWSCAPDGGSSYTAGAGIAISAANAVSLVTCATGQVLKSTGAGYACAADESAVYTAATGGGLTVAGNAFALVTCPANQILKSSGSAWVCTLDQNTTYVGGSGITVNGNIVALTTCATGQILKSTGTGYACAADNGATYAAGTGLLLSGTTFSANSAILARKDAAAGNQAFDTDTLFLDYTNNRVGVGTATPTVPLDVDGFVRATGYLYAQPYTRNATIPPYECQRSFGMNDTRFDRMEGRMPGDFGGTGPFVQMQGLTTHGRQMHCPIALPIVGSDVTVTAARVYFHDRQNGCNIKAELRYKQWGTTSTGVVVSTVYSGTGPNDFSSTPGSIVKTFPAFTALNTTGSRIFWIEVTMEGDEPVDCMYGGVQVDYRLTGPG